MNEQEITERIRILEEQIRKWVDGMLDLNERERRLRENLDLERNKTENMGKRLDKLQNKLPALEEGYLSMRGDIAQVATSMERTSQQVQEALRVLREQTEKAIKQVLADNNVGGKREGGWDEPGT